MNFPAKQLRMFLLLLISLPLSLYLFNDFIHSRHSPNDRLVHGLVIEREMSLQGQFGIVDASLSLNGINDMPDVVTFYYSGDPNKEVYLQEEYNPIWGSIFFVFMFIFSIWYFVKRD